MSDEIRARLIDATQRWQDAVTAASAEHDIRYYGTDDPVIRGELVQIHLRTHARLRKAYDAELAEIAEAERAENEERERIAAEEAAK